MRGAGITTADFSATATFVNPTGADRDALGRRLRVPSGSGDTLQAVFVDSDGFWYYQGTRVGIRAHASTPPPEQRTRSTWSWKATRRCSGSTGSSWPASTCRRLRPRTSMSAPASLRDTTWRGARSRTGPGKCGDSRELGVLQVLNEAPARGIASVIPPYCLQGSGVPPMFQRACRPSSCEKFDNFL